MSADPTPLIFLSTFLLCCCCCGGVLLAGGIGGFMFVQNRNQASKPSVVEGTVTRSEAVTPAPEPEPAPAVPVNLEPDATRMAAPPPINLEPDATRVAPPPAMPEPPAPEAASFPQTMVAQPAIQPPAAPEPPAQAEDATQLAAEPPALSATDDIGALLLRLNRADRPYQISRDDTRIRVDVPSASYVLSISFLYEDKLARFVTVNAATGFSPDVDTALADVRRVLETFGWRVRD